MSFAHVPTPLEPADRLGAALGLPAGRLFIKRDDLTGLATGGNKARKLELLVSDALSNDCDVLVSVGGLQSNHARVTAAAAARAGMGCVLAFNTYPPQRLEANQLLDVLFGAERRFVGPIEMGDLNAVVEDIATELRAANRRPYVIPVGGSSPVGASAYAAAADEIASELGHDDLLVVTATGSGGTQAGLAARLGHARVIGIDVGALDDPAAAVRDLAIAVTDRLEYAAPVGEPRLVRDQIGDGYGAPTDACLAAIRLAARTEGLILDPVYSGKAMAGLMALHPSELERQAVIFLSTGGVPALFESRYEEWLTASESLTVS
jgi:D-cysteine desulfhydrase family pyridoxal phosphate-dependent enzyme